MPVTYGECSKLHYCLQIFVVHPWGTVGTSLLYWHHVQPCDLFWPMKCKHDFVTSHQMLENQNIASMFFLPYARITSDILDAPSTWCWHEDKGNLPKNSSMTKNKALRLSPLKYESHLLNTTYPSLYWLIWDWRSLNWRIWYPSM